MPRIPSSIAALLIVAACKSGSDEPMAKFADGVRPIATTANTIQTQLDDLKSGKGSITDLFKGDGALRQIVTLFDQLGSMPHIDGIGPSKACTDAWYAATDKMKAAVESTATALRGIADKDPSTMALVRLVAEWERRSDDFDASLCLLAKAAGACIGPLKDMKLDVPMLPGLAARGAACK